MPNNVWFKGVILAAHAAFQLAQDGDGLMSHAEFLRTNACTTCTHDVIVQVSRHISHCT